MWRGNIFNKHRDYEHNGSVFYHLLAQGFYWAWDEEEDDEDAKTGDGNN